VKTHRGVQSEFHRLTQNEPSIEAELRAFLSRAYTFKTIADYDLGSSITTTEADARLAIETAARFVERLRAIIARL
jgi:uncharacterized protein (UPF0332 family)